MAFWSPESQSEDDKGPHAQEADSRERVMPLEKLLQFFLCPCGSENILILQLYLQRLIFLRIVVTFFQEALYDIHENRHSIVLEDGRNRIIS